MHVCFVCVALCLSLSLSFSRGPLFLSFLYVHVYIVHMRTQGAYQDHGRIEFPDGQVPSYVNSIAITYDGTVHSLGRMTCEDGKTRYSSGCRISSAVMHSRRFARIMVIR